MIKAYLHFVGFNSHMQLSIVIPDNARIRFDPRAVGSESQLNIKIIAPEADLHAVVIENLHYTYIIYRFLTLYIVLFE